MAFSNKRAALLLAGVLVAALTACGGNNTVPSSPSGASYPSQGAGMNPAAGMDAGADTDAGPGMDAAESVTPDDTTSILKKLKKDVVIGSTIDPKNHDKGPRGVSVARFSYGQLKKGEVLVCNFENSAGDAGKGTTVEKLGPGPGKPARFVQNSKNEGCADDSVSPASDDVYTAAFTSHLADQFTAKAKLGKTWSKDMQTPFSIADGACVGGGGKCLYSSEYIFVGDAGTGGVVDFSVTASLGNPKPTQVVAGFAVNKATGWDALGPSGFSYSPPKNGTLYVADGVDNTVVAIESATYLLQGNEITVEKGGKTFKCKYKTPCAKLVHSGSPLNAPVAMTLLPNGNLIVANTKGGNTLVELTPTGQVLATKVVDKGKTPAIFGLRAIGSSDSNTAVYYTDLNDNSLHELEQ